MELRDAIKVLREELGVTQLELATALHVTSLTVSRWELGKSRPNRAVTSLLLGYAYTHNVKKSTMSMLKSALADFNKKPNKTNVYAGTMAMEHSSLSECFDAFPSPIYVCDVNTDMMLYANKVALRMIGTSNNDITKFKCYECLIHRDTPCEFCHKSSLTKETFTPYKAIREFDESTFLVYGKLIRWNGHDAQIRLIASSDSKIPEYNF